jgi:hypothetical protein
MSTRVRHQLTGHHRRTERVGVEHAVPVAAFKKIKKFVRFDPKDPDAVGSYLIGGVELRMIGNLLGQPLDNDKYEYFLEPIPL